MLYNAPQKDPSFQMVCSHIDDLRNKLRNRINSAKRWRGLLSRQIFARNIQGSNTIEGYNLTTDDAIAVVANDEPMEADNETRNAAIGYRDAMTYVLQLADDPHFTCGTELIKSLHFMMMHHVLDKNPGRWRGGIVHVRNVREEIVYEPPDADLVPSLMSEFVTFLNALGHDESPLVHAAMGHLNLTLIHPFKDGNGRMARCLQTLILSRQGILGAEFCSIEEYLGKNSQAYYQALNDVAKGKWSPDRSPVPFIKFCLTAHYRQARTLLRRVRVAERLWEELDTEIRKRQLPERMVLALYDASTGHRVTNARYRKTAELAENLASRDFAALVKHNLLSPEGERRGRYYIRTPFLAALFQKASENEPPIPDPFEFPAVRRAKKGPVRRAKKGLT